MNHALSVRSQLLISLFFAVPLAVLGFQAAAWWGVIVGVAVGAMLASRVLLRGAAGDDSEAPAMFLIRQAGDDATDADARRAASLKREFDRAVCDGAELSPKPSVLH